MGIPIALRNFQEFVGVEEYLFAKKPAQSSFCQNYGS